MEKDFISIISTLLIASICTSCVQKEMIQEIRQMKEKEQ